MQEQFAAGGQSSPPLYNAAMPATSNWPDRVIAAIDEGLRAVATRAVATRPSPADTTPESELDRKERRTSAALMRVNHAGEIAAQALYSGQSLLARSPATYELLVAAAREERDHLAWVRTRLDELGGRVSMLTPFWYASSFCIGVLAGALSDPASLGFVRETERQVEAHLRDHLRRLPEHDRKSAAILARMTEDEVHHGTTAALAGGSELPGAIRRCMSLGGEILRRVALIV
jgi:3-demethoxyubiquinol 3-hydroxylase